MPAPRPFSAIAFCLLLGCGTQPPVDLSHVHGSWTTTDTRYEGRFFELSEDRLVLGLGEEGSSVCSIEDATCESLDASTRRYDLTYVLPNGEEGIFSFEHSSATDAIHFANQRRLAWYRSRP